MLNVAAVGAGVVELTTEEMAIIVARRNGLSVATTETIPVSPAVPFVARMERLACSEGTDQISRNLRFSPLPICKINTTKGVRGVFWVGYKNGVLRVGSVKLTNAGRCYKPGVYSGIFYQDAADLVELNPS